MKKVYIIYNEPDGEMYKIFSSRKFADEYLNQLMAEDNELFYKLSEPEEHVIER